MYRNLLLKITFHAGSEMCSINLFFADIALESENLLKINTCIVQDFDHKFIIILLLLVPSVDNFVFKKQSGVLQKQLLWKIILL